MASRRGPSFVRPSSGKGTFIGNPPPTSLTPSPPTPPPPSPGIPPDSPGRMIPHEGRGLRGGGGGGGGGPNGSDSHLEPGGLPYSPRQDGFYPGLQLGPGAGAGHPGGERLNLSATSSLLAEAEASLGNATLSPLEQLCDEESDPFCMFANFTLDANGSDFANLSGRNASMVELEHVNNYWTILLIIFPMFTVFGNVLVVMSVVREKSLKTVTNYFICSLAVADIMVAVVVMPFAVYVEVVGGWWLSDLLCDAWVAADVMACTASILNLTAISVDRFIAVTQPIKYAKHKNSKRVYVMIAVTWVVSVAIAMPISLGVNYSEDRVKGDCAFYNADFIIYSSMGSFYIPSIIMIFLYWKIYRVIRQRAHKAQKAKKKAVDARALQSVIENTGATAAAAAADGGGGGGGGGGNGEGGGGGGVGGQSGGNGAVVNSAQPPSAPASEPTVKTGLAKMDNGRVTSYNTTSAHQLTAPPAAVADDASFTNVPSGSDSHNDDDDDSNANVRTLDHHSTQLLPHQRGGRDADLGAELIANPGAAAAEQREGGGRAPTGSGGSGGSNEAETPFTSPGGSGRKKRGKSKSNCAEDGEGPCRQKKGVTKFNFHMRTSRKRKEKSSSRREKKATKTLAIVLGGFLLCWVPFFTINNVNAICIRYKLQDYPACNPDKMLFAFFVWLGYINSFLNPVIYTIFNPEFRKAFKKILTEPCFGNGRR